MIRRFVAAARGSHPAGVGILLAMAAGGILRFAGLGDADLWLDEILHHDFATVAAGFPLSRWLLGVEREVGALFLLLQLAARHLTTDVELGARIVAATAGTLTVGVVGRIGRRLGGGWVGLTTAVLIAGSPQHIVLSREARPYALILLLVALVLHGLVVDRLQGNWIAAGWMGLLLLPFVGAVSAPFVLSIGVVAVPFIWSGQPESRGRWCRYLLAAGAALVLLAAIYGRFPRDPAQAGFAPMTIARSLSIAVESYAATAREATEVSGFGIGFGLLAAVGAVAGIRRQRAAFAALTALAVLPPLIAALSLVLLDHWLSSRYLAFGLIAYLILVAYGWMQLARLVSDRAAARGVALAVVLIVAAQLGIRGRSEANDKVPWSQLVASIAARHRPPELVVAASDWTYVCLKFYDERRGGSPLPIWNAHGKPDWARIALERFGSGWLVVAGYTASADFSPATNGLTEVWAGSAETARVYFFPNDAVLRERGEW